MRVDKAFTLLPFYALGMTFLLMASPSQAGLNCGNGSIDLGEQCDDGNLADDGNCCSATCQYITEGGVCLDEGNACTRDVCDGAGTCQHNGEAIDPMLCIHADRTKLQIRDSETAGADKLSWQWSKGGAFEQPVLGTPLVATTYTLCVYDSPVQTLAASIEISPSMDLWSDKDPKGLAYKDSAGTSGGVLKAQIKTGADGRTSAKVSAGGLNLVLPGPVGATYFNQGPNVMVQLVNSEGTCWTSAFTTEDTKTNVADSFKAQVK